MYLSSGRPVGFDRRRFRNREDAQRLWIVDRDRGKPHVRVVLATLANRDVVRQHDAVRRLVVAEQVLRRHVAEHRFRVDRLESRDQLRLRIEVDADLFAVSRFRRPELEHFAVELFVLCRFGVGHRVCGGEGNRDDVAAKQKLRRVLRSPAEEAAGRRCHDRPRTDDLDTHGRSTRAIAPSGQDLVAMLREVAVFQLVVERRAPVYKIGRLGDVGELRRRAFHVADTLHLAEPVPRTRAALHDEHLNPLNPLLSAHRGQRVVGEQTLGWRGGTGREKEPECENGRTFHVGRPFRVAVTCLPRLRAGSPRRPDTPSWRWRRRCLRPSSAASSRVWFSHPRGRPSPGGTS